uniref:Opticin n=1 Tax=Pelusios castaneus TaxID=367368 RepID=A0A8C8VMU2_9SAUR
MQSVAFLGVTTLALVQAMSAPPKEEGMKKKARPGTDVATYDHLDPLSYDLSLDTYSETIDLSLYEELYDYGDLAPKVRWRLAGALGISPAPCTVSPGPGCWPLSCFLQGLPTCLVCVCLSTSVYCDDADLEEIPPLPLETTYLYARFNRIGRIRAGDFAGLKKLKRIDLTSNFLSCVDQDSFWLLTSLQELLIAENRLTALPALPSSIVRLDARFNRIQTSGLRPEAFRVRVPKFQFLYHLPRVPLPEGLRSLHLQNNNIQILHEDTFCDSQDHHHVRWALEDIRLDGNPINLSLFPNAYICLPRLPTGLFY